MEIDIRRVRPADADVLRVFYAGLSAESRRARFLGTTSGLGAAAARSFCTPDHMHDEGFVAFNKAGELVGHLCLAVAGPQSLELGIAVADGSQGKGVGRRLFEGALDWARDHGYEAIIASCFVDNWRVLSLLSSAPHHSTVTAADGGVVDVVIPIRGPLPRATSSPPYTQDKRNGRKRRRPVKPLRVAWRRTPPPARVAGD